VVFHHRWFVFTERVDFHIDIHFGFDDDDNFAALISENCIQFTGFGFIINSQSLQSQFFCSTLSEFCFKLYLISQIYLLFTLSNLS
jgi:hypothetical protein